MAIVKNKLGFVVEIYDTDFDLVTVFSDYLSAQTQIGINETGACTISLHENHYARPLILEQYFCIVHLANNRKTGSTIVFSGRLETVRYSVNMGTKQFQFIFAGLPSVLQRSVVAWKAATTDRSQFTNTAIHDIINDVIQYNHFLGTTANGRERTSDNDFVQFIEYSSPASDIDIDFSCAWRNVFDVTLQMLEASGYELESEIDTAFNRVLFNVDYTGLGEDKSDTFFLSEKLGTVLNYSIIQSRSDYKNVAIVGGGGTEDERSIVVRISADYNADTHNAEMFVDARQTTVTSSLEAIGDSRLQQSKKKTRYSVDLAKPFVNRLHPNRGTDTLWLGDSVSFVYLNTTKIVRIVGMTFDSTQGASTVRLTVED